MNLQGIPFSLAARSLALVMAGTTLSVASTTNFSPSGLSIAEIKNEIESTESRLDELPLRLIRESGGTLGFRTRPNKNPPDEAWVEVDLEEAKEFDTIILVPAVLINENRDDFDYGFPERYQIRTYASTEDKTGQLLFDSTSVPGSTSPNRTPVIINCPSSSAHRIRVVPQELAKEPNAPRFVFALSELLVFNQHQNHALGKPVTASDSNRFAPIWNAQYLTDGYVPFSQPRTRKKTKTNFCQIGIHDQNTPASITLDLGKEHRLDEVRLYPVHIGSNFAVFHRTAQGFPRQFTIEISTDPLFTSPTVIFDTQLKDYPSPGHRLVSFSADNALGRFVRITALQPAPDPHSNDYILAFAEIEIISEGRVVSLGVDVAVSHATYAKNYSPEQLVDGLSSQGTIPPLRTWLVDLSERNRLETKLQMLQSELQHRYHRQSLIIQRLGWIIAICVLFFMVSILWQRLIRQRHIYRLRENIAADLHDEIGGNFSGIALLCDELASETDMPQVHIPQLMTIADTSRTSASNTRDLVRFLESHGVTGELIEKMQSTADRMLTKQTYRFDIEGAKHINKLTPKEKWHLLLFFKEALTNIVKHAESTEVSLRLHLTSRRLNLAISDNGHGMNGQGTRPPSHLAMRAQKLKSKLTLSTPPGGGTEVTLEKKL